VTLPQTYIGVDVAKDWIDVCDPAASRHERIPTDRRSLRKFAASVGSSIVILEASGGYERPVMSPCPKPDGRRRASILGRPANLLALPGVWPRVTVSMRGSWPRWDTLYSWFRGAHVLPNASVWLTLRRTAPTSPP